MKSKQKQEWKVRIITAQELQALREDMRKASELMRERIKIQKGSDMKSEP
ncbi:hypothetical protein [Aeromonas veronii]